MHTIRNPTVGARCVWQGLPLFRDQARRGARGSRDLQSRYRSGPEGHEPKHDLHCWLRPHVPPGCNRRFYWTFEGIKHKIFSLQKMSKCKPHIPQVRNWQLCCSVVIYLFQNLFGGGGDRVVIQKMSKCKTPYWYCQLRALIHILQKGDASFWWW